MLDFVNLKFENFRDTQLGEDLFDKADKVNMVLSSNIMTGNEALGMIAMDKISSEINIKEKDGNIHKVIMLG